MSLARMALRILTVAAVRGSTFAGDAVRDSEIGALDAVAQTDRTPIIAVYVDEGDDQPEGRELTVLPGSASLVIEVMVTGQMVVENEAGEVSTAWGIAATDAGLEITLDMIEDQVRGALMDPANAWSELWRTLVSKVTSVKAARGSGSKDEVRFAARQLTLQCDHIAPPPTAGPASPFWTDLAAALSADDGLSEVGAMLTARISGAARPSWAAAQAEFGLVRAGVDGMGVTPPFVAGPTEEAPLFELITVAGDDADRVIAP